MLRLLEGDSINYFQESPNLVRRRATRFKELLEKLMPADQLIDQQAVEKFISLSGLGNSNKDFAKVIKAELAVLLGTTLSDQDRTLLACGIAGSYRTAAQGFAYIHSNDIEEIDVWCKIYDVAATEVFNKQATQLTLVICNSTLAGRRVLAEIERAKAGRWASMMGLRGDRKMKMCGELMSWHGHLQLVGANMIGRVSRVNGQVLLHAAGFNKAIKAENKELARKRERRLTRCPFGANYHCAQCEVGINECGLSCNRITTKFFKVT